jgi:hypothetical protein
MASRDYGPFQLADYLGITRGHLASALKSGLIPPPDRPRDRWSAAAAETALAAKDAIVATLGTIPDLGAVRAAEVLTGRLGVAVTASAVEELARQDRLPVARYYKGHALYSGRALEAFADKDAAVAAGAAGATLVTAEAVAHMRIRPSDFAQLRRAGRVSPLEWVKSWYGQFVPVYRAGDLDGVLADPSIDWDAVRATPRGHRSLLADLVIKENADD